MRKNFGPKTWMYPAPVLIIAAYDENGTPNAMNAAWGGIYDTNKVCLCISAGHKTTQNIKLKGEFTVSFATVDTVVACDYVGLESGNKVPNKLEKAGFHTVKAERVDAPVIQELPMTLECKLVKVNEDGIVIGEVVNVSADESVLDENGTIDPAKLQPICFDGIHGTYQKLGDVVAKAFSAGSVLK